MSELQDFYVNIKVDVKPSFDCSGLVDDVIRRLNSKIKAVPVGRYTVEIRPGMGSVFVNLHEYTSSSWWTTRGGMKNGHTQMVY